MGGDRRIGEGWGNRVELRGRHRDVKGICRVERKLREWCRRGRRYVIGESSRENKRKLL